ncbi:dTDP-4-dehydrorhamnose 3,5-epimerase [Amorphus suaedae]
MRKRFDVEPTSILGVVTLLRKPVGDDRGLLARLFCDEEFRELGLMPSVRQINQSRTRRRGTIRGMHFQHRPHAEAKLVSCLKGEIFDVAVDLRRSSPTFLQWHGQTLSGENFQSLYIPPGCAHGFQTLTDDCELLYLHSEPYQPQCEGALNALDPALGIVWPLDITDMSDRDRAHPNVAADFDGIEP